MPHSPLDDPTLTVAIALTAGIVTQATARHLRLPGIMLLLIVGAALGPDGLGLVRPSLLGDALPAIVDFSVAVILFEGGLSLDVERLKRQQRAINQLVLLGPFVTVAGTALAARYVLGWSWTVSLLLGTLVIVTGPTVINPLLRRFNVQKRVRAVLEAEGVITDALGAIVAVVALQVALRPGSESLALGALEIGKRLAFGAIFGALCGGALSLFLRPRHLVPERLRNVVTLALVFAIYAGADAALHESGIAAVIAAGMIVGSTRTHQPTALAEFKEELTVMLIGLLFVLLTAQVRLEEVLGLGWGGLAVVAVLVLVVRPLHAWLGTMGSELTGRERAFVGWIAPRGIVAAAIATLFADALRAHDMPGGVELRAMVFLVIAVSVLLAGATGGLAARWLGVRRPTQSGWVLLGTGPLGVALARALDQAGCDEVVNIELDPRERNLAEDAELPRIEREDLLDDSLREAEIDLREGAVAVGALDALNLLFIDRVAQTTAVERLACRVSPSKEIATRRVLSALRVEVLCGRPVDPERWAPHVQAPDAIERWRVRTKPPRPSRWPSGVTEAFLPLAIEHGGRARPFTDRSPLREGDHVMLVVDPERADEARRALYELGLERVRSWTQRPASPDGSEE